MSVKKKSQSASPKTFKRMVDAADLRLKRLEAMPPRDRMARFSAWVESQKNGKPPQDGTA